METKFQQELEIKAEDNRVISGYGATFNDVPDSYNDVIAPGAFLKSLNSGRKVKMAWNHDLNTIIGRWDEVREDSKGLFVKGTISKTNKGDEVYELIRDGSIDSFSIGYKLTDKEYKGNLRIIKSVELYEVSVVSVPANANALIDAVKAATLSIRDMEDILREAGLSKSVAQTLLSGGYDALTHKEEKKDELAELMKSFSETLKSYK